VLSGSQIVPPRRAGRRPRRWVGGCAVSLAVAQAALSVLPSVTAALPFAHASSPVVATNSSAAAAMGHAAAAAAAAAPLSTPRLCSPRWHPRPRGARSRKRTVRAPRRCLGSACMRTRTCSRLRSSLRASSPRCTRSRRCRSRRPPRPLRSRTCSLNLDTILHVEIDDDGADEGPGKGQGSGIESDDDNNDVYLVYSCK
jgi:hypothetical protein